MQPPRKHKVTPLRFVVPTGWPAPVYDFAANPLTQEGVALGRRLFYDGQLSKDGNFPCASCHQQFAAFATLEHPLSHGFNNALTTRNAPALFNLAWQPLFMDDGRIARLDEQPLTPLMAPDEMAADIHSVLRQLRKDSAYRRLFGDAFGDATINTSRMMKALSQFMLTMVSANSKYDRVQQGIASFTLAEQLGYGIFKQKCAVCHREPLFSDFSFRNIGAPLDSSLNDAGRMRVTHLAADSLKFRVPSLRNVALTAPYGHDGRFFSLYNVFEHYRKAVVAGPTTDTLLKKGIGLSNFEIGQLTAFLYTLTDSSFVTDKQFAMPAGMHMAPAVDAASHQR